MQNKTSVYLDYAASTPLDEQVLGVITTHLERVFGNPSSVHRFGQKAEDAVSNARQVIADILNCLPEEIIFTGCGSESDNLALRGAALAAQKERNARHILISPVEHHAVSHTAQQLAELHNFELEYLPVDEYGMVQPAEVESRLRDDTALVSVIYANNEIGTINPIGEIGAVCRASGIPFHSDAVQAGAYLGLDVQELQVDLLALGAHKFYGPKGVGVLYVRGGTPLISTLTGGGQESGLRAGTHNVPYIAGMAEALKIAQAGRSEQAAHAAALCDQMIAYILSVIPDSRLTGHPIQRLPNHASFTFKGVDGNALLMLLDTAGFACSSSSACKTGSPEPSEVLTALGLNRDWALGSLRVTIGKYSNQKDIELFLDTLPGLVERLRWLNA